MCVGIRACVDMLTELYTWLLQVFLVRKISGEDAGTLYAMKVLKKATLKGACVCVWVCVRVWWV